MLPNFLVIGAEKAGTTWLYECLSWHPGIFLPLTKEIHYFNSHDSNLRRRDNFARRGLAWYKHFFRGHAGEVAVGEVTPMYLCDQEAPERIQATLPDVRLIACLRHPVERAYSHYWMARGKGHTDLTFEEVVQSREPRFVERGCYGTQLARYLDWFERDQILVLIHEEVFSAPSQALNSICAFLGIDDTFFQDQEWMYSRKNSSAELRLEMGARIINRVAKWMRHRSLLRDVLDVIKKTGVAEQVKHLNRRERPYPSMRADLRRELTAYFESEIRQTERLIGRPIDAWHQGEEEQNVVHG